MDLDLVIRGGTVIAPGGSFRADLGIRGESIAALGQGLCARQELDATGRFVLPGAIDPHVHLQMATRQTVSSDDWETGTIAAACGGTTTVLDFVDPAPEQPLLQALAARQAQAAGRAVIDYGLHMTLRRGDAATLAQAPAVVAAGCPSFKAYTTYEGYRLSDPELLAALSAVSEAGGLLLVHCESDAIVSRATQSLLAAGRVEPRYHPQARPAIAEGEAAARVLALAETAQAPVYLVHLSTTRAVEALARARRQGLPAWGETCPQYLALNEAEYEREGFEGAKYVCSPPLRRPEEAAALWAALAQGEVQTVGTDHCPFDYRGQKELGRARFTEIPGGLPGIEARLALLYTLGVRTRRLSLERWVEVCCTGPARLFGLYPRKGALVPGADADVVIFDPQREVTLGRAMLHERVDYTPYEGTRLQGYPETVIARGRVLAHRGEFTGPRGAGRFLRRDGPPAGVGLP